MRLVTQANLFPADVLATGKTMAGTVPAALDKAVADAGANGLHQPILHMVNDRSRLCARPGSAGRLISDRLPRGCCETPEERV